MSIDARWMVRAFKTVRVCSKCGRKTEATKRCPYCGGDIILKAVIKKLKCTTTQVLYRKSELFGFGRPQR